MPCVIKLRQNKEQSPCLRNRPRKRSEWRKVKRRGQTAGTPGRWRVQEEGKVEPRLSGSLGQSRVPHGQLQRAGCKHSTQGLLDSSTASL